MKHLLDNIFWHALSGPQAEFAAGNQAARRYAPDFSAIVAFADQLRPGFSALAAFCEPGETLLHGGLDGRRSGRVVNQSRVDDAQDDLGSRDAADGRSAGRGAAACEALIGHVEPTPILASRDICYPIDTD